MSCFPCFQNNEEEEVDKEQLEQLPVAQPRELDPSSPEAGGAAKEGTHYEFSPTIMLSLLLLLRINVR